MIKPKKLKKGDTISLITPASFIQPEKFDEVVNKIKNLGFNVIYNESACHKMGYLAGTDKQRVDELHQAFENKQVDAIMCTRGGYGTSRILPMLDYDLIKKNPKIFIGFSDITALLHAIYIKTGLICFHGPMGVSEFTEYTTRNFENILMCKKSKNLIYPSKVNIETENEEDYQPYVVNGGIAEGQLFGGNLALMTTLIGTPYDIDYAGKLIFLEEIGEQPYRIDRMITQLLLSNKLKHASGIIIGVFKGCSTDGKPEDSFTIKEIIKERLADLNIPIAYGIPFGHIADNATLPLGIKACFDADNLKLTFLENAVIE